MAPPTMPVGIAQIQFSFLERTPPNAPPKSPPATVPSLQELLSTRPTWDIVLHSDNEEQTEA